MVARELGDWAVVEAASGCHSQRDFSDAIYKLCPTLALIGDAPSLFALLAVSRKQNQGAWETEVSLEHLACNV